MAARGWAGSILTAIGVSAAAGAAQLGLGYGLGIVVWTAPPTGSDIPDPWLASLAWVVWIAATSTVLGAVAADRLGARAGSPVTDGRPRSRLTGIMSAAWRLAIALSAAIGGLITVPLVALPARAAHRVDAFVPSVTAGAYAVIGVLLGLVIALAALSTRAIAANVVVSASWLWGLAAIAVINGVRTKTSLLGYQIGVWQFIEKGWWRDLYVPGALVILTMALVVGALAAWPAGRRGDNRIGVVISGAIGPGLVAAAYFLGAPSPTAVPSDQKWVYVIAPYAVLAGIAGSVLIAALSTTGNTSSRTLVEANTGAMTATDTATDTAADTGAGTDAVPKPRSTPVKRTRASEEAALADWAVSLSSLDKEYESTQTDSPTAGLGKGSLASPSSQAGKIFASDDGDDGAPTAGPTSAATATTSATGSTATAPLWPDQRKPAPPTGGRKPRKRG